MVAISNGIRCQGCSFICLRAKGHSHVISDFQESLFGMNFAQLLPTPSKNRFTLMLRTSKMIVYNYYWWKGRESCAPVWVDRCLVYPIIYGVLYIPGAGFLPSTVSAHDPGFFFHQINQRSLKIVVLKGMLAFNKNTKLHDAEIQQQHWVQLSYDHQSKCQLVPQPGCTIYGSLRFWVLLNCFCTNGELINCQ